jgi:hypothetical protein
VPKDSHPGFGGKDPRYDELNVLVKEKVTEGKDNTRRVRGVFRSKEVDRPGLPGAIRWVEMERLDIV